MAHIQFTIPGPPRGKDRARIIKIAGRSTMTDTKENRMAEARILKACREAMAAAPWHGAPLTGPVKCEVVAVFEIPASWPKWKKLAAALGHIAHLSKPDCSNIVKLVEDAVNPGQRPEGVDVWPPHDCGYVYADDSQINDTRCVKKWGQTPLTVVRFTPLDKE